MMTENGVTTTTECGQEQFEEFVICGRKAVQYDYRFEDGTLYSTVGRTLEECRRRRDYFKEVIDARNKEKEVA